MKKFATDTKRYVTGLLLLLLVYGVLHFLCTYRNTFGERDSYRVFDGVLDAFIQGKDLASGLVYGYGISRGYFAIVATLRSLAAHPLELARALNLITYVSVVASLIPISLIARALAGNTAGLAAAVIVMTVPIWVFCGEYAHPMWPAIFFILAALAAVGLRSNMRSSWRYVLDLAAVCLIGLAFSMRVDVLLMAPMFLAFCFDEGRFSLTKAAYLAALGIAGIGIGLGIFALLPSPPPAHASVPALLAEWHNPKRFVANFGAAQLRVMRALNPLLVLGFVCAIILLIRARDLPRLAAVLPLVLLNYLFWIPNPQPERHFLYLVPGLALALAFVLADAIERPPTAAIRRIGLAVLGLGPLSYLALWLTGSAKPLYFIGTLVGALALARCFEPERVSPARKSAFALGLCLVIAAIVFLPGKIVERNPYDKNDPVRLSAIAGPLLALPRLDRPVVVISDAYPVIAAMLINPQVHLNWSIDVPWIDAKTDTNDFIFFIQGWVENEAAQATLDLAKTKPIYLVVDPQAAPHDFQTLNTQANIIRLSPRHGA